MDEGGKGKVSFEASPAVFLKDSREKVILGEVIQQAKSAFGQGQALGHEAIALVGGER
jgi:hypothetical protein